MKSLGAIVLAAILAAAAGTVALLAVGAGAIPRRRRDRAEANPSSTDRRFVHPAFGPPSPCLPGA